MLISKWLLSRLHLHRKLLFAVATLGFLSVGLVAAWLLSLDRPITNEPHALVRPGQTTEKELADRTGKPYTEYSLDDLEVKTTKSNISPYQPDRFYLKDGVVVMKEVWYEPTLYRLNEAQAIEKYGTPDVILYNTAPLPDPEKVLISPRKGIAIFLLSNANAVSHIQFFESMTLERYRSLWGKLLSEKKPSQRNFDQPPH